MKQTIKALLATAIVTMLCQATRAQLPLPFYEPFSATYTNGGAVVTINGIEAPGSRINDLPTAYIWSVGGGGGNGSPSNHIGAKLVYPGLGTNPAPDVGVFLSEFSTGTRTRAVPFTDVTSGKLYASFLLNVLNNPTNPSANRLVTFLTSSSSQSTGNGVAGIFVNPSGQMLVGKNSSSTPSSSPTATLNAGANLVVVRYTFDESNPDEFALWLNPGSLSAPEGSEPTPTVSTTAGADFTSLSLFYIAQRNNVAIQGVNMLLDEVRLGTNWAQVTPTGAVCIASVVLVSPTNQTLVSGLGATFHSLAYGTEPTYQWQLSTNAGSTWNSISGANSAFYTTPVLSTTNSGNRYRVIANVACGGGSSSTSAVAMVTVNAATPSPLGLVVDDTWEDGDRSNTPVTTSNSVWYASTAASLTATVGTMTGTPVPDSSRLWVGYFTNPDPPSGTPIDLDVGRTLKTTLKFTPTAFNSFTNGGDNMRFGLFDYADGGVRLTADDFGTGSTGNGVGVRGYLLTLNWGTNFTATNVLEFSVRSTLDNNNLIGQTDGIYTEVGRGPGGVNYSNTPAFQAGTEYTLELSVARTAFSNVRLTATLTGGSLNISFTTNENYYAYHRFDSYGVRPVSLEGTADSFNFTQFRVEVTTNAVVVPNPIPLNIQRSGTNVVLTWSDSTFKLQAAPVVTGSYTNVTSAASPYTTPIGAGQTYYRLIWP